MPDKSKSHDIKLEELAEISYELLVTVLANIIRPISADNLQADNFRQSFIRAHAEYICRLANDTLHLEDQMRTTAPPLIIRGMLESLFILGAAVQNKSFAGEKLIFDLEETARYAKRDAEKSPPPTPDRDRQDCSRDAPRHPPPGKCSRC